MGLTGQSTGMGILKESFNIQKNSPDELVIAVAGNPNVGKSTVFNSLTGLKQHTGNWPGKTVTNAQGRYKYKDSNFVIVDLPGTYSLMANSVEEEIARDFVCFGSPDATLVVTDATCLERNLNLVLQTMEITNKVVVCVNLIDEAERKKIKIDLQELSRKLGVPVVGTNAKKKKGLKELMDAVYMVANGKYNTAHQKKIIYNQVIELAIEKIQPNVETMISDRINPRWVSLKLIDGDEKLLDSLDGFLGFNLHEKVIKSIEEAKAFLVKENIDPNNFRDKIVTDIVHAAEEICTDTVTYENEKYDSFDRKIDSVLTSRIYGIPIMIGLLGIVFWLTITGSNYPSQVIATLLFWVEEKLTVLFLSINSPIWLHGILVLGLYRTLAWVVSVMLPPMAIFFPLFTLLEDLGYLPRVAFNLDNFFKKACAHGKQALTMCMGFGCNAAGVIGCRIIDSPRERTIATITNNFVPCNGRFPILISISAIFIGGSVTGAFKSIVPTIALMAVVIIGILMTLIVSKILSKTLLKGLPSSFTLELPPYRKPQVGRVIVRSIFDRTLFVLGRAITVAAPAGIVIWLMANISVHNLSLLDYCANFLEPFAYTIGMDGYIIMAFILGLPANEIVIPIVIMSYMATGSMLELDSLQSLRELLVSNGWTWLTGICVMLFTLLHFPCGTTLWTIKKETQSIKWTLVSFIIPTLTGIVVCFIVAQGARLFGLV